jgi:hypothetical protein
MDTQTIFVSDGRVIYNGTSGPAVIVTGGNSSLIDIDGTPIDPVEIAEESLAPVSPVGVPSSVTSHTTEDGIVVYAGYNDSN